jgi:hypothetical protein
MMYTRKLKESHLDTVKYEIVMLDFCAAKLPEKPLAENVEYLYLEGFLLHYRNLIAVFGGRQRKETDLTMKNSAKWAGRELSRAQVAAIRGRGKELDKRYWEDISQYLAHCTMRRSDEEKGWNVTSMRSKIAPVIAEFERAFLANR